MSNDDQAANRRRQEEGEGAIRPLLFLCCGESPDREGLQETPKRAYRVWRRWCSCYEKDPSEVLKQFDDGAEGYDVLNLRTSKERSRHAG